MKEEIHQRLWAAQQRWFEWKAKGETKRGLKLEGLRDFGDLFARTRYVIFTGATRVAYERELKRFIDFAHQARGKVGNRQIDAKDFRAYIERHIEQGAAAKYLSKVKSAIAKFGALYGRAESFAAMSRKIGKRIRELVRTGELAGPDRPHVTPEIREAVIGRLRELDDAAAEPRAYHLVVRLQQEASLRVIEATERFTRETLRGLVGEEGTLSILGKGGRIRLVRISKDLYQRIEAHFMRSKETELADRRGYQQALRRATLAVGGRATGSHAHRRTSATEIKNERYWEYAKAGVAPKEARERAVQDTVEHLGHSRWRKDSAAAYLS
jgi:site-specific recombinase XerC